MVGSLDRSRLAEVTRSTDSRKARIGAPRCGPFYSQMRPASFASASMGHAAAQQNPIAILFCAHEGRLRRYNNRPCRKSRPLRFEPTSLWLVLNIIQRRAGRTSGASKVGSAILVRRLHDPAHCRMQPSRRNSTAIETPWCRQCLLVVLAPHARNEDHIRQEWRTASLLAPMAHRQTTSGHAIQ